MVDLPLDPLAVVGAAGKGAVLGFWGRKKVSAKGGEDQSLLERLVITLLIKLIINKIIPFINGITGCFLMPPSGFVLLINKI